MKITISDISFHKNITSRYWKWKGSLFVFPSMFFLKSARNYLSRIIDMHIRLDFQIQKFHEMISGFHEINKISVNGTTAIFKTPIFNIENYHSKKLVSFWKENAVYEKSIFNSPMIINRISNFPMIDTVISARTMNDHVLNYSITANAAYNYFTSGRMVDKQISNYLQIRNNIISYTRILNDVNSLNYIKTKNAQTLYSGNNFTLRFIGKNHNTIFKESTNFWKEKIETNQQILNFNTKTTALSDHIKDTHKRTHKRIVFFPARSIHFGFATQLKPEVQNGINGPNNNTAGADIVFKKPQSENKITGEKKLQDEKTISAKIRADKQIKNVPPQMLQGEISSIANKVYKLLERRLSIEKEKRGVHIIG